MPESLVEIETIAQGGDGLGREPDGRVVFVPRTAPGERVTVELTEEHKQWARGRLLELVEAAPERREAPCPYYVACGGCQLQHMEYEAQARAKAEIVMDALERLGGISIEELAIVPAPQEFNYRNRISLTLRREDDGVRAGYHAYDEPDRIVDVAYCPLAEPPVNRVWGALRDTWGPEANRLPQGRELRLTLRCTAEGSVGLVIDAGRGRGHPDAVLRDVPDLAAIWGLDDAGTVAWHAGEPALADRWGPHELQLAADTFTQVNRQVAHDLEAHVLTAAGEVDGRRVVDAYCGLGLRSLELARRGADVVGIDNDEDAVSGARHAATEAALPARFHADSVETALPAELPADLVILNPPRRGVAKSVCEALVDGPPARIVYVSCDPPTLARDLGYLQPAFSLTECRAFDMFPQTAHVETVATLQREGPAAAG